MVTPDPSDQNRRFTHAESTPPGGSGTWRWCKNISVKAVWNDDGTCRRVPQLSMPSCSCTRIVDDPGHTRREKSSQADRGSCCSLLRREVIWRVPYVPDHRNLPTHQRLSHHGRQVS